MGIINVTPDSFSGDGLMKEKDFQARAVNQALRMIDEGADILDIGGESSRPGSKSISADEEIQRVVPVLQSLRDKISSEVMVSIDTVKAGVAEQSLRAGATIINDISALQNDPRMAEMAVKHNAFVVLMDNRSQAQRVAHDTKLGNAYLANDRDNIVALVKKNLSERAALAEKSGISPDKIIIDPGLGFGKTVEQNLKLIAAIPEFKKSGYPVLIGPSRKNFIGQVLGTSVDNRLEGTASVVSIATFLGADVVRVHDVGFMSRVARLAATLVRSS